MKRCKIFGIGLGRTGTKSLTKALTYWGYRIVHYPTDRDTVRRILNGEAPFEAAQNYDGITDDTTVPYFENLAARFPTSRFIYTSRGVEPWLSSMERHWTGKPPRKVPLLQEFRLALRQQVYGCQSFDEGQLRLAYSRHEERVQAFFRNCPQRLLEIQITDGEGWSELATFLGEVDPPTGRFPHEK